MVTVLLYHSVFAPSRSFSGGFFKTFAMSMAQSQIFLGHNNYMSLCDNSDQTRVYSCSGPVEIRLLVFSTSPLGHSMQLYGI